MKNYFLAIFIIITLIGCASADKEIRLTVEQEYKSVNFDDGITQEEAVLIAKKNLLDRFPPDFYVVNEPVIITEFESVPHYEDYWFVYFRDAEKSRVPDVYMVSMERTTGKIVFARNYNLENEWVLEAAFLKIYERTKKILQPQESQE